MSAEAISFSFDIFVLFLGIALSVFVRRAKELGRYWLLVAVIATLELPDAILLLLRWMHSFIPSLTANVAYAIYFWAYYSLYAVQAAASILVIRHLFNSAMRPLKGLHDLGQIIFYWVAGISLALGVSGSFVPHDSSVEMIMVIVTQLIRASSILVLSLLIFVAFCIKPLGLSLRSRVFGVSSGLSLIAISNLVLAAALGQHRSATPWFSLAQSLLQCSAEVIWIVYFALPEPKRKFILLPTTSPFHKWNLISEMLGHDPGYVAIGGVAPENFASAEIEIFHRASAKMPKLAVPTAPQPVSPEDWLRSGD